MSGSDPRSPLAAAVLGAGKSGRGAATLLLSSGYRVTIYAQETPADGGEGTLNLHDSLVPLVVNSDADELAAQVVSDAPSVVVISPGIPERSPLMRVPIAAGISVIGEVQLAWNLSHQGDQAGLANPWLCITGTNGKTTTVGMTSAILEAAGDVAPAVGNIGNPITDAIEHPADVLAVELSSFQLTTSPDLEPLASICLNIDSDHLDWHGSRERYAQAKARVYDHVSGARLYFADQSETEQMARGGRGSDRSMLVPLVFGEVPEGGIGFVEGKIVDRAFTNGGDPEVLAKFSDIALFRNSDLTNPSFDPLIRDALAAAGMARAYGVPAQAVLDGLRSFVPQGHRRALVPTGDGIAWIDDSKATNVHAALAAAKAITPGTLIWIIGGDAKGQDLSDLFKLAKDQAKAVVLVGADTSHLLELASTLCPGVPVTNCQSGKDGPAGLKSAVRACAGFADAGDTVLLAPGCASWDQFDSYGQRGDLFQNEVQDL